MSIEKNNPQKLTAQIDVIEKRLKQLTEQKMNYVQLEEYEKAAQTRDKEKETFQEFERLKALRASLVGTNEGHTGDYTIELD
ncbi:MAG: hypothetical protein GY810_30190 [Aureispira sp.]|nr:hypothetical protein [Aureispira sp.]